LGAGLLFTEPTVLRAIALSLLGAFGAAWVLTRTRERDEAAYLGWTQLAAAAFLVGLIFLSDRAANRDLVIARNEVAPILIDACEAYREARDDYPDELEDLVPDYMAEIPRPRIGLIRNNGEQFLYTNLGDSYILEFACAKWVQCAYSPPYHFGDPNAPDPNSPGSPDVAAGENSNESLEGSWSCDPSLPKLW
jgi:hypothetical protein